MLHSSDFDSNPLHEFATMRFRWAGTTSVQPVRTYVSPIGYNSTSVTRPVLRGGLESGDRIVLIRPEEETDEQRANEAIADVERLLGEIEPAVELDLERIPHDEFGTAVLRCGELLTDRDGRIVVNLAGGAREILIPLVVAAIAHADAIDETLLFSDVDGSVTPLDWPALPTAIPGSADETFRAIAARSGRVSVPQLTDRTAQSKSTVTRHVTALEETGLVEAELEGNTKVVEATFAGRLLFQTLE